MSNRYFKRRAAPSQSGFGEEYWGVVEDPDGNVRDRRQERERFFEDASEEIAFLRALPPARILDLGCGLGFLLSALDERWERHGVEVSSFAASYAEKWGTIHHGNLESARFPDGYFDVVVLYHVIEHISDPVGTIWEVNRVLKAGGMLLFATPDFESGCARRYGSRYRLLHDQTHISLFDSDSAHRFLRDHGFVIDRVEYPFFKTRHFTRENLERLFDTGRTSPPFYGNFMTFYAHKPICKNTVSALQTLGMCGRREIAAVEEHVKRMVASMAELLETGRAVGIWCEPGPSSFSSLAVEIFQHAVAPAHLDVVPLNNGISESDLFSFVVQVHPGSAPIPREVVDSRWFAMVPEDGAPLSFPRERHVLRVPVPVHFRWNTTALLMLEALAKDVNWRFGENRKGSGSRER